jgi:hypothetical protein
MAQSPEGTAPPLTPEQFVEELRALRARIADVMPLTPAQRRLLRYQADLAEPVIHASINIIGASDLVTQQSASRPKSCAGWSRTPTAGRRRRMSCGRC